MKTNILVYSDFSKNFPEIFFSLFPKKVHFPKIFQKYFARSIDPPLRTSKKGVYKGGYGRGEGVHPTYPYPLAREYPTGSLVQRVLLMVC
jgi:hypothetical protein